MRLYSAAPWGSLTGGPLCALDHLAFLSADFKGTLVTCQHGPLEELALEKGVETHCFPLFAGLRQSGRRNWLSVAWRLIGLRVRYVRDLFRLLRGSPGILQIHCRDVHLPYALLAARLAGVPVAMTLHETWMDTCKEWWHLSLMRLFRVPVVCLSHAMAEQYPRLLKPAAIIPNAARDFPANPRMHRKPHGPPVIGMVGTMVPEKGVLACLEVARLLKDDGIPFQLRLVGGWPRKNTRDEAETFISMHGLGECVEIAGELHSAESIYGGMDIFFLPTRRDSFPRVVMEAMAWQLPVVATRVDGIPEMVEEGETGFLVTSEDVRGFAAALERLLADESLRNRMGQAGRERAEKLFSPASYREAFLKLYGSLPGLKRLAAQEQGREEK